MFNAEYRKIMDGQRPLVVRYFKFRHCLEWYCYLTRQSFQATYRRLGREFGFDESRKPDETQLIGAAALLNRERVTFLRKLEAFAEQRRAKKAQGSWQPRKAAVEALYRPDWLETSGGNDTSDLQRRS